MVVGVRDEVSQGAIDTFAAEPGVGGEVTEDLENNIFHEAGVMATKGSIRSYVDRTLLG